jgi:ubiquinone/menaquinone biosynthesis C-methylase UbiE
MDKLSELLPTGSITSILDLGAGTGRFAASLANTFKCRVIAVDPSEAMLEQGKKRGLAGVMWLHGSAEHIPLEDASVDLVWMSQVFHHLRNPPAALEEIRRVLKLAGYLAVRNATRENNVEVEWSRCFPEARQIELARTLPRQDLLGLVCGHGFHIIAAQTVSQVFASSYAEYYDKISQRGLSSLISISDEAFTAGLERLKQWVAQQPADQPVNERVDLFVFRVSQ